MTEETAVQTLDPDVLSDLLRAWLPSQRWFAGKQRGIDTIAPRLLATFGHGGPAVQLWLAEVTYLDGFRDTYQIPLSTAPSPVGYLGHAHVGEVSATDGGVMHVYDALWDKKATPALLEGIVGGLTVDPVHFHLVADHDDIPLDATSMVLTGEQSNTSLVFGDQAIMKVFRRVEVGQNPDIEIHEALARTGGRHLARILGYIEAVEDGQVTSLAMLQQFMSTATDGWELAKISVRDLMAEADLHAEEAGGDFAGEAYRLGVATAEVHSDLATALGTETLTAADMRTRADHMVARLEEAIPVVPHLNEVAPRLREAYEAFAVSEPLVAQRVHGDLHLGQVLRTEQGWVVLDFEGEPVRSIESRRARDSSLRDVAGMMRSFDYAANHQVIDSGSTPQTNYRANEWSERNRDAFCAGYARASGSDPRDSAVLLRAFEADKAVYEAVYEARNRPAWLPVPLASLGRLSGSSNGSSLPTGAASPLSNREAIQ
ncbi:MAG: putative pep2 protein [Pseudonocardiales bacterium]|nr:putative pep2 protein [Pseudonocardiales bacterium]